MFRRLNKKGQNTLEYAVLIAVIVAALIAMQRYINRGMQGKLKASADDIGKQFDFGRSNSNYTEASVSYTNETFLNGARNTTYVDLTTKATDDDVKNVGLEKLGGYGTAYKKTGNETVDIQ